MSYLIKYDSNEFRKLCKEVNLDLVVKTNNQKINLR